jgi:hypothetical protein
VIVHGVLGAVHVANQRLGHAQEIVPVPLVDRQQGLGVSVFELPDKRLV